MEAVGNEFREKKINIKPSDIDRVVKKKKPILRRASKTVLRNLFDDIKVMLSLIKDWSMGDYPYAPWWTIAAIGVALTWLANPADMIPDMIPLIGLVDDLTVLSMVLAMCEQDIKDYVNWVKEVEIEEANREE